jgi:hypothetical protein
LLNSCSEMGKYPDIDVAEGVGIADAGRIEAGLKPD